MLMTLSAVVAGFVRFYLRPQVLQHTNWYLQVPSLPFLANLPSVPVDLMRTSGYRVPDGRPQTLSPAGALGDLFSIDLRDFLRSIPS